MRWLASQSSVEIGEGDEQRRGGILGEGRTVWEMAAASLHYNVLLDSEECHE